MTIRRSLLLMAPVATLALSACQKSADKVDESAAAATAAPAAKLDQLERAAFNRAAVELNEPLFWAKDDNGNRQIDPAELAVLWGMSDTHRREWVADDKFTKRFGDTYARMVKHAAKGFDDTKLADEEKKRRLKVREELAQGRPTVVRSDFTDAPPQDQKIVEHVLKAAALIEQLHARQNGVEGLIAKIPADDSASRTLFYRNQGPKCVAPKTESDPDCHALPGQPKVESGLYPSAVQTDGFCEALAKRKDADTLMHQFHVVRGEGDALTAVPYTKAYEDLMTKVSAELEAAAAAIETEDEAAFKAYLSAAATAFKTNDWQPADEAWSKMNVHNSKWYLRIGPDEVYFEPCSRKAGFHVSFARINQDSLKWQKKLDPVKGDLEKAIAALAGKPYVAREVSFHLPDFIDIIVNAGDSRSPHGATIGQSLPNWGPVANEGRGRTVAMTNLYTDADSRAELTKQAKSILCADAMTKYTSDPEPQVMSTVLHEAAHNLGPAHEYKVNGKTASQIFGGPMASTMEELKAQTAALYYTDWLAEKGIISAQMAEHAHTRDLIWGFGHISRGMYSASGRPKPYSQLAAIQLGFLEREGAATWRPQEKAANGEDVGCLAIDLEAFPAAAKKLMTIVAKIKGRGDKAGTQALRKEFVDAEDRQELMKTIQERWLRAPKASFVYAIDM